MKVTINKDFLHRLKQARTDAKLNQKEVAKYLGYESPSTIGNYEAGRREVSAADMNKLTKLYGVSWSWLSGDTKEKNMEVTKVDHREWMLIRAFRQAQEHDKQKIENLIDMFIKKEVLE